MGKIDNEIKQGIKEALELEKIVKDITRAGGSPKEISRHQRDNLGQLPKKIRNRFIAIRKVLEK